MLFWTFWRVTLACALMAGVAWATYTGFTLALGVPEARLALETGWAVMTRGWMKVRGLARSRVSGQPQES